MALAGFFRISLHKGDKYMRVREELEFVRNFVMIQQIRFPEKFEVEYQVEEDILDCKILKIVIQPFVENAIKHGVAPKPGKGHIRITGKKENEDLVFEILDDDVGFREGDEGPKNGEADGLNGYGVSNVDERLKLEYGEDYGVTVTSCRGRARGWFSGCGRCSIRLRDSIPQPFVVHRVIQHFERLGYGAGEQGGDVNRQQQKDGQQNGQRDQQLGDLPQHAVEGDGDGHAAPGAQRYEIQKPAVAQVGLRRYLLWPGRAGRPADAGRRPDCCRW